MSSSSIRTQFITAESIMSGHLYAVEEVNQIVEEETKADNRFDEYTDIEGKLIVSWIKKFLKRKTKAFKKNWNFIFSRNKKGCLALNAQIIPIQRTIKPYNKNLEPLPVQDKIKVNNSWKEQKRKKQYN